VDGRDAGEPVVTLAAIEVREAAPGTRIDLSADAPIVWTSYRDATGALVIELPNTEPGSGVTDLASQGAGELFRSLTVRHEANGGRPLTRVTVEGGEEFEYSLASDGNVLQLRLLPTSPAAQEDIAAVEPDSTADAAPEAAIEPAASAAVAAPAPLPEPAMAAPDLLTPDQPIAGPMPTGAPATRLEAVETTAQGDFRLVGDGEFAYTLRRLTDPERFVIDLDGVSNHSSRPTLVVGGEVVERIRVAQFRPRPEPVARVVFDLRQAVAPALVSDAGGLTVRFGGPPPPREAVIDVAPTEDAPAREETEAEIAAPAPVEVAAAPVAPLAPPSPPPRSIPPASPAPAGPPPSVPAQRFEAQEPGVAIERPEEPSRPALQTFGSKTLGGGEKTYTGEPITLSLRDNDVVEVLRAFAEISNLNMVIQPGVGGVVTVELKSVPWDQALEQILKMNNLGAELEGNILRIAPIAQLRAEAEEQQRLQAAQALSIPLRTIIKRLSYATAGEIAQILQRQGAPGAGGSLMSQRGSVTIDARTNTLLIKELPEYMDTVIAVIEELDTPEPQVMIEARIVETTKNFTRTLGIQWNFDAIASAATGNTTGLVFPNNVTAGGGTNLLTGGDNGFLDITLGNILNTFTLDASLLAAENEGLINILSTPKVATLNNQQAEIQSGLQIPIQTVSNNTVSVQFVNATLRLSVTPHVTAEGTVLMDINVQKREPLPAFLVAGAGNAPISTKEARTRVIVRDGGTTVIGGIYRVASDQGQDRVPGLANIPIVGHLFRNRRRSNQNEELLIFITPRVIKL
jgi:type IV pilus assembly protein PilQ